MISWPLARCILLAALRDRLILSMLLVMFVGASVCIFLGSAAITETDQFAVVFTAGALRLAGITGLVLFTVFYLSRSIENRDVEFLLSRPISRTSFVVTHALSFSLLALIIALFVSMTVFAVAPHLIGAGHVLWTCSLMAEFVIVANLAMFFAMVLPGSSASALAVLGFYVLARLIGQILGIIEAGLSSGKYVVLEKVMQLISLVIPRLDVMGQTSWLVYGSEHVSYVFLAGQAGVFSLLVIAATLVDLKRKQF